MTDESHELLMNTLQWYVDHIPWQTHRTAVPPLHRPISEGWRPVCPCLPAMHSLAQALKESTKKMLINKR